MHACICYILLSRSMHEGYILYHMGRLVTCTILFTMSVKQKISFCSYNINGYDDSKHDAIDDCLK